MSFHEESRLTTRSQNLQAIYEQARRAATAFELLSGPWCAGELAVRSLHGSEAMSRCFRFDVEFQSDIDPATLHAGLVARSATLLLRARRSGRRASFTASSPPCAPTAPSRLQHPERRSTPRASCRDSGSSSAATRAGSFRT